jgi:hypothetical protein
MIRIHTLRNTAMPADAPPLGVQSDGRIATVNPQSRDKRRRRLLWIAVFRLLAAASLPFQTAGATAGETTTVSSPICNEADLRLVTLIEAHGETQDVAADTLAQAFFTVLEARKACNAGHVEAAMKLYESIPLGPLPPETVTD